MCLYHKIIYMKKHKSFHCDEKKTNIYIFVLKSHNYLHFCTTVWKDLTVPHNYWSAWLLRQQESPRRIQKSPAIHSPLDSEFPAITSLKIKHCPQDCQSPAITSLKNKHYSARAENPRQSLSGQIFLRTVDLRINESRSCNTKQDCLSPRNFTHLFTSYVVMKHRLGGHFKNTIWKRRQI